MDEWRVRRLAATRFSFVLKQRARLIVQRNARDPVHFFLAAGKCFEQSHTECAKEDQEGCHSKPLNTVCGL